MFNQMVEYCQEALNRVFSAVADPTRRAILASLAKKPATITEIAKPFRVSLNAVSKHVMVLERAGLVRRKIRGREHVCSLEPDPFRDATEWLDDYRQFWDVRLDALERYVARKMKGAKRRGDSTHGESH
jgi:DNA-binding transcriptional ArsR family regulator